MPDIAILDLSFGETREAGLALLGALRVEPQFAHLPVLVVSGASDYLATHADAFAALGAVTLAKPMDIQALLDTVARFVSAPPRDPRDNTGETSLLIPGDFATGAECRGGVHPS